MEGRARKDCSGKEGKEGDEGDAVSRGSALHTTLTNKEYIVMEALKDRTWLSAQEAADYLGCSYAKVLRMAKNREIPKNTKLGLLKFNRQQLDDWMLTGSEDPEISK